MLIWNLYSTVPIQLTIMKLSSSLPAMLLQLLVGETMQHNTTELPMHNRLPILTRIRIVVSLHVLEAIKKNNSNWIRTEEVIDVFLLRQLHSVTFYARFYRPWLHFWLSILSELGVIQWAQHWYICSSLLNCYWMMVPDLPVLSSSTIRVLCHLVLADATSTIQHLYSTCTVTWGPSHGMICPVTSLYLEFFPFK
jgi:hypothetical protein